ncbi:unnamed protein product, partial [Cyprideis torosa]
ESSRPVISRPKPPPTPSDPPYLERSKSLRSSNAPHRPPPPPPPNAPPKTAPPPPSRSPVPHPTDPPPPPPPHRTGQHPPPPPIRRSDSVGGSVSGGSVSVPINGAGFNSSPSLHKGNLDAEFEATFKFPSPIQIVPRFIGCEKTYSSRNSERAGKVNKRSRAPAPPTLHVARTGSSQC